MSKSPGSPHKILIVEDESVVSMDLELTLERLGYEVSGSATSGEEAFREISKERPDLILMDIQLHGELDGMTTAETISHEFGIPVVFVTANVNDETIARARQSGSYGYLNKPFRPSEVNAAIEIALHQHESSHRLNADRDRLEEQVHRVSDSLGQTREELQALSRHLIKVQEEERARIARELHDDLGQQVALLGMQADILEQELTGDQRERAYALRLALSALAESLREASHKLHPSIIADLGLTDALFSLVREFRSQGLIIRESLATVRDVPFSVSTSLYRITQESLRNVLKHAPSSTIRVNLTSSRAELNLRISDNGRGFSLDDVRRQGGLGLISMKERARLVGGNLLLSSEPNKGTTVLVRVPLRIVAENIH